jgi:hypothetical protein
MVSWTGDGLVSGYDPTLKKLSLGLYHLASPGSVDLGGSTRINYQMGAGLSTSTYPNRVQATMPVSFTSGDFAANPGAAGLSAAMAICAASNFPEGHVPTPSEILALGDAHVSVFRASLYIHGGAYSGTLTIPGFSTGLLSEKYWVLVYPTALVNPNSVWNLANDKPMAGVSVNTIGRAVSLWGNKTPAAPTITSPASGSIALPGSTFNLTINPNDPDESAPDDGHRFNADVAGIQFQYAPAASPDNPTPAWLDLPLDVDHPVDGPVRLAAWHIRGSRFWNGLAGTVEHKAMIDNLGMPVVAGAGDGPADIQPGKGALPAGEWQLRARTFDFGHPYPNDGTTTTTAPGPLGINPATTFIFEPAKDYYPPRNTSPWSAPVRVSVPAQVPPPIPLSPVNDLAVIETEPVRLTWQYRNTHQPPREQYRRAVQIRAVGDIDWATIFDGYSALTYVDVPTTLTQTVVPPIDLLEDSDFEDGTLAGWVANFGTTLTNVNNALNAHSGNRYLRLTDAASGPLMYQVFTPSDDHSEFTLSGYVWVPASEETFFLIEAAWFDGDGNQIMPLTGSVFDFPYLLYFQSAPLNTSGWHSLADLTPFTDDTGDLSVLRPPEGVTLEVIVWPQSNIPSHVLSETRVDDLHFIGTAASVDDFSMEATNAYEWRVQTTDTDSIVSNYSDAARFWMVPAADSGEVRPVPTETTEGATLGCGTHRVEVYRRGASKRVGEITSVSYVDWNRVRDDISTSKVVISGWDVDCGNLLSLLEPWAYELVIFRDNGYSVDRVWEGPITLLTYETDAVTIEAKDVMGYAYRRIIKQKMTDTGTGNGTTVVDRARRVLQNVFAPDDPNVLAYLRVLARDDDAMQYRSTPAYSRTAFEEVDDMAANAGLDYTVIGRSIMLWGTKHRIGTLPEFTDRDLGSSPIVSVYGMSMANRYVVSDGNGVWGEATRLDVSGNDETYGLVEMLSSTWATDSPADSGTYTQAGLQTMIDSFTHFAERSIADRYPPPVVVRVPDNTTLNPGCTVSIQHLVPGVVVPLRSTGTLREVVASQKLDSIKVVETKDTETVSITLSPFSRDDAATQDGGADA